MVYKDNLNQNYVSRAPFQNLLHVKIPSFNWFPSRFKLEISDTQVIQAKKASDEDVYANITLTEVDDIFLHDFKEINKSSFFNMNYPIVDNTGLSFIYDNTTFSDDSPLDFLGGSLTNYSRIGHMESFGSVESLSLDEFN